MVNRKSRTTNFIQNGSPKKRIAELNSNRGGTSKKVKKSKSKRIKTEIIWEGENEYNQVVKKKTPRAILDYTKKLETYKNITFIGQEYEILKKYLVSFDVVKNILKKEFIESNEVISEFDWSLISEYVQNKIRLIDSNLVKNKIINREQVNTSNKKRNKKIF